MNLLVNEQGMICTLLHPCLLAPTMKLPLHLSSPTSRAPHPSFVELQADSAVALDIKRRDIGPFLLWFLAQKLHINTFFVLHALETTFFWYS